MAGGNWWRAYDEEDALEADSADEAPAAAVPPLPEEISFRVRNLFYLAEDLEAESGSVQEDPADIVLKFSSQAAADARRFLFHPSQANEELCDGSLVVRFRSGGFLELVRHLFTWGDAVEILAPKRLRDLMIAELELALVRHRG